MMQVCRFSFKPTQFLVKSSSLSPVTARLVSTTKGHEGGFNMNTREKSQEKAYFSRKDRVLLQRLVNHLGEEEDPHETDTKSALHKVFAKHDLKLTAELEADLREWKKWVH
eukprot:148811_1